MNKTISKRITMVNFVMTLCIAVYHFGNAVTVPDKVNDLMNSVIDLAAVFAMNWFFMVTGLLLFRGFSLDNYREKIKKRFVTVLLPYLIWQIAFGLKSLANGNILNFVQTVFLFQKHSPDGPLWYMYAIFFLALLSPLFYVLLKNRRTGLVAVALITIGAYYMRLASNPVLSGIANYGRMPNLLAYLPSYVMGLYLGLHQKAGGTDAVLPLLTVVLGVALPLNLIWEGILRVSAHKILVVLLLYSVPVVPGERFYKYAGVSFIFYAIHRAVDLKMIVKVRNIALAHTYRIWLVNLVCYAAMLGIVLFISFALWLLLSLISPRMLKVITGGRVQPLCRPLFSHKKEH